MSAPGFASDEAGLRRRAAAVARVADALRDATVAADVALGPDAYGVLCGFFPDLLAPVRDEARAALGRAAMACGATVRDLRAADAAFTGTDDTGAAGFGR